MGLFGFGKKERILDLSVGIPQKSLTPGKQQEKTPEIQNHAKPIGFFDSVKLQQQTQAQNFQMQNPVSDGNSESPEEKRQKFMKKFQETIERLDTLSTQIYHLQQRIEVLEKKMNLHG